MIALVLCAGALLLAYAAGRRSLEAGLAAVIGVGYFYGIIRANVAGALSYFIFDAAVVGLYGVQLLRPISAEHRERIRPLMPWLIALIGWPAILLLLPLQDPMVQLVGFRAHVFFLPFLFLGARLEREQLHRLILWVAVFNIAAFAFAVAEFTLGVERFYPRNEATELIYRSRDVQTGGLAGAFRIPAIFGNAQLYGASMVITLPFLLGRWLQREDTTIRERLLLTAALFASILGVFFSASRVTFLIMAILLITTLLSGKLKFGGRIAAVGLVGGVIWVVAQQERLFQRLTMINLDVFAERISWSLNESLIAFMFQFPFGNGLGGGGSNMPFFLAHLIRDRRAIENHYGTILLELGVPGLFLWLCFIGWIMTRRTTSKSDPWFFGRRLLWITVGAYFGQALIGIGLMSALPFSVIFLMGIGWMVVRQAKPAPEEDEEPTELGKGAVAEPEYPRYASPLGALRHHH